MWSSRRGTSRLSSVGRAGITPRRPCGSSCICAPPPVGRWCKRCLRPSTRRTPEGRGAPTMWTWRSRSDDMYFPNSHISIPHPSIPTGETHLLGEHILPPPAGDGWWYIDFGQHPYFDVPCVTKGVNERQPIPSAGTSFRDTARSVAY